MNALIKVVITTILGYFGPLSEVDDKHVQVESPSCPQYQVFNNLETAEACCNFREISLETLKYKFDS